MTRSKKTYAAPFTFVSVAVMVLGGCMIDGPPETDDDQRVGEEDQVLVADVPSREMPGDDHELTLPIAYDDELFDDAALDASEMQGDAAVPSLAGNGVAAKIATYCEYDEDCGPDAWCGKNIDGDSVCRDYVGDGDICGGYMPHGMQSKCGPGLECVFDSPYPDFPGTCEPVL